MSFRWEDIADAWREAFKQPEIDGLLDEFLSTLLDENATLEAQAAARGGLVAVLRLQSAPEIARARKKNTAPVVVSALSWRQRLLSILRTHYSTEP